MRILALCTIINACVNTPVEKQAPQSFVDVASRLECTILHTTYTGDELQSEIDAYTELEDPTVYVSFYRVTEEVDDWWEVETPVENFSIVSWEVVEDGWTDMYGDPLKTVVFAIDLWNIKVDDEIESFLNENGSTELEEGEDVWLHATGGTASFNMYLFTYGYEADDGFCAFIE